MRPFGRAALRAALQRAPSLFIIWLLTIPVQAGDPSARSFQLHVPFFPDKTDQCGPATLAGLLTFWGKPTNPERLRQEMYEAKLKGTLPMDLTQAARDHGLEVKMLEGTVAQVKNEIAEGRPVLAMLNMGFAAMPVGHYVIITGWDDERKGLFVHSGGQADQFIPYKKFDKKWKSADYWAMFSKLP